MNKKILVFFIITIIAIVAVIFYKGYFSPTIQSGTEHTVELGDIGFYPQSITIKKGDTVTFTTKRKSHFWPASNLHPSHTIYPEFDPQEPVDPKDSWSFKFKKTGTWRYHDHLSPYFTGTVTVEE